MAPIKTSSFDQLNHDQVYNEQIRHFLREVTTTMATTITTSADLTDEVTEILNEMETTTDESITQVTLSTGGELISQTTESEPTEWEDFSTSTMPSGEYTTISDTFAQDSDSPESSQTILIVLGILLAILVIVCCVLACIFARMRRKGFCTVEGKNQATCDDDCQEDAVSLQQSPKESMASGKSEISHSRSSDKLLTK